MAAVTSLKTWLFIFLSLTLLIICTSLYILNSTEFNTNSDLLSLAVTIDITIVIPLLYYLIVSRKLKALPITSLVVFLCCIGLATLILPHENQYYLDLIKNVLIVTELIIVTYGIIKIKRVVHLYKHAAIRRNDFLQNLFEALESIYGRSRVVGILVSEIGAFRYGLFFWLGKKEIFSEQKYFTIHKKSGYTAIWSVLCFVIFIEMVAIHLLFWNWNEALAIALTILSIYSIIFFIADFASILKRPIVFYNHQLYLRIGIRWNAIIDINQIQSIEIIKNFKKEKQILDCSIVSNPNVLITLYDPTIVTGIYGIKRTTKKVAFNIDSANEFIEEIKNYSDN